MKAMILAAGLGTRLRPLTNDRPKALVEIAGRTMLELALERLRRSGVNQVIINVHHFADLVIDYLAVKCNFGLSIEISREDVLLDTGGGLKKAAWFFLEGPRNQPFLLHNVDVISTVDLARMVRFHIDGDALATLATQARTTERALLFDQRGQLHERAAADSISAHPGMMHLAFAGIHVISPRIFDKIHEEGAFSIIDSYVRLAAQGERITAFRADEYYWRDLGRPENVQQAERDLAGGALSLV